MADEAASEVLAILLRISERLESLESLLRAQLDHSREAEAQRRRMFAALSILAGNGVEHDE